MTFYKNHKEKLELLKSGNFNLVENVKHFLRILKTKKTKCF